MATDTTTNKPLNSESGPTKKAARFQGFLPITTNTFDQFFISLVLFIAINLLWFRFIEQFLPIHVATAISVIVVYVIIRWG